MGERGLFSRKGLYSEVKEQIHKEHESERNLEYYATIWIIIVLL